MTKFRVVIHDVKLEKAEDTRLLISDIRKIGVNKIPPSLIFELKNNIVTFKDSMLMFADELKEYENGGKTSYEFTKLLNREFGNLKGKEVIRVR